MKYQLSFVNSIWCCAIQHSLSLFDRGKLLQQMQQPAEYSQVDSLANRVLVVGGYHDGDLSALPQVDLPHYLLHHRVVHLCRRLVAWVDRVLVTH